MHVSLAGWPRHCPPISCCRPLYFPSLVADFERDVHDVLKLLTPTLFLSLFPFPSCHAMPCHAMPCRVVPPKMNALVPWCGVEQLSQGETATPIFTPEDGYNWKIAKACFEAADFM